MDTTWSFIKQRLCSGSQQQQCYKEVVVYSSKLEYGKFQKKKTKKKTCLTPDAPLWAKILGFSGIFFVSSTQGELIKSGVMYSPNITAKYIHIHSNFDTEKENIHEWVNRKVHYKAMFQNFKKFHMTCMCMYVHTMYVCV